MPVPDFSPGEVLTASAMDSIPLWLVKSQTIGTTQSTIPVTNAFISPYSSYRVVINGGVTSSAGEVYLQFSGITGNNYYSQGSYNTSASATVNGVGVNIARFLLGYGATNGYSLVVDIHNPNTTKFKFYSAQCASDFAYSQFGGVCNDLTNSSGFTISFAGARTGTGGTISVYGYKQ